MRCAIPGKTFSANKTLAVFHRFLTNKRLRIFLSFLLAATFNRRQCAFQEICLAENSLRALESFVNENLIKLSRRFSAVALEILMRILSKTHRADIPEQRPKANTREEVILGLHKAFHVGRCLTIFFMRSLSVSGRVHEKHYAVTKLLRERERVESVNSA